jgi:hypothetical protein
MLVRDARDVGDERLGGVPRGGGDEVLGDEARVASGGERIGIGGVDLVALLSELADQRQRERHARW